VRGKDVKRLSRHGSPFFLLIILQFLERTNQWLKREYYFIALLVGVFRSSRPEAAGSNRIPFFRPKTVLNLYFLESRWLYQRFDYSVK
jgi:hypothetical protein